MVFRGPPPGPAGNLLFLTRNTLGTNYSLPVQEEEGGVSLDTVKPVCTCTCEEEDTCEDTY